MLKSIFIVFFSAIVFGQYLGLAQAVSIEQTQAFSMRVLTAKASHRAECKPSNELPEYASCVRNDFGREILSRMELNAGTSQEKFFDKFDPTLGTLDSVQLSFLEPFLIFKGGVKLHEEESQFSLPLTGGDVTVREVDLYFSTRDMDLFIAALPTKSDSCGPSGTGLGSGVAVCTAQVEDGGTGLFSPAFYPLIDQTMPDLLAEFIIGGGGDVRTTFRALAFQDGNVTCRQTQLADPDGTSSDDHIEICELDVASGGNFKVEFNYTPFGTDPAVVPEPSTLLLFGTGMLGLLGYARRRKILNQ